MKKTLTSAVISAIALVGAHQEAQAADFKCYGIAKAGQNGCGALDGSHACAGHAKVDNSPVEWIDTGTEANCKEKGGMTKEEAQAKLDASK